MAELTCDPLEPTLAACLKEQNQEAGAVLVFAGTVRRHNVGREVAFIEYTAHQALAVEAMNKIEQKILAMPDILFVRIWHRIGRLELGETSVLILVSAIHRAEAYLASRQAIEELKHRVPIWKHEHYTDGSSEFTQGCPLES